MFVSVSGLIASEVSAAFSENGDILWQIRLSAFSAEMSTLCPSSVRL